LILYKNTEYFGASRLFALAAWRTTWLRNANSFDCRLSVGTKCPPRSSVAHLRLGSPKANNRLAPNSFDYRLSVGTKCPPRSLTISLRSKRSSDYRLRKSPNYVPAERRSHCVSGSLQIPSTMRRHVVAPLSGHKVPTKEFSRQTFNKINHIFTNIPP
jgi:hypothetical protein